MNRVKNFNAGPAALPLPALERAREEFLDFAGSGMSVMEHSHRGKEYEACHDEAIALLKELLAVPDTHEVLFVQGGASQLFAQIPMNLVQKGGQRRLRGDRRLEREGGLARPSWPPPCWAARSAWPAPPAPATARRRATSARPAPGEVKAAGGAAYLHLTSNETIHGVAVRRRPLARLPRHGGAVPLIADMSSDFLWKKIDVSRFGLVYAGAQKNIGPSGVVVMVMSKALIEQGRKDIPKIFQFRTPAENKSLYNTPPTFGIYMIRNVLAWLKGLGGLAGHGGAQPQEGRRALRRHRRQPRLLQVPGREAEPLGDERGLPAARPRRTRSGSSRRPRPRGWSA